MADGRCYTKFSAQERGAKLCNQFLARISLTAKAAREIPVKAGDMPCPVTFMPISA